MRFSPSFLDDIKARLPVSEVVRRRVKLVKAGREWKGLSPFNSEKTPSFFVNDQKMAWFDFSSGKNGNVFDFVMATEGLSFPEAVERLAQEAGLQLPVRSEESERHERRRAGLHEILEWAAAFFETELRCPNGARARSYLEERGVSPSSRAAFRIGYAPPGRHALRDALADRGATVEAMCEAGLLIHGDGIPVAYDRFRDRVTFPITDRSGRIVAFGGRALEKDVQPKYSNSPETPLFHKGAVLFNHYNARKAAHDARRVIVVEGYIDVVAMHAAGFAETVAPLGTALTEEQAGLLWQMAPEPILCFDGDKAGRKAAYRAAEMALPLIRPDRTFAFALLPEGQDPDDLIRASGAVAVHEALESALPLVDVLWARETEARILTTPEQRAGLERDLAATCATIRDESLRRHYRGAFDERLRTLFRGTIGRDEEGRRPLPHPRRPRRGGFAVEDRAGYLSTPISVSASLVQSSAFRSGLGVLPPREATILAVLLAHPSLVAEYAEELASLDLAAPDLAQLRDHMLDRLHGDAASSGAFHEDLAAAGFETALSKLEKAGTSAAWYLRPEASQQDAAAILRQALILHRKAQALHKELLSAETALATDASEANLARMRDIQEQIGALSGMEAAIEGFGALSGRPSPAL